MEPNCRSGDCRSGDCRSSNKDEEDLSYLWNYQEKTKVPCAPLTTDLARGENKENKEN